MDKVQVGKEQCRGAGALVDDVRVPKFFDDSKWHKNA